MARRYYPATPEDDDDLELPVDRSGTTWRFGLAFALFVLCLLAHLHLATSDPESMDTEWTPLVFVPSVPLMFTLLLSAIGIRRGWSPHLLFRLLPHLLLIGLVLLVVA